MLDQPFLLTAVAALALFTAVLGYVSINDALRFRDRR